MKFRLKYPPTPENASKFAADIVDAAADISGANLDYSVASLKSADDILEGMRQDGCTSDQIAETLFGFGCYVGEVLVRQANGKWRNTAVTPMDGIAPFPLVIELNKDNVCDPISKVFKRLKNGEEDSLYYFYRVLTMRR